MFATSVTVDLAEWIIDDSCYKYKSTCTILQLAVSYICLTTATLPYKRNTSIFFQSCASISKIQTFEVKKKNQTLDFVALSYD